MGATMKMPITIGTGGGGETLYDYVSSSSDGTKTFNITKTTDDWWIMTNLFVSGDNPSIYWTVTLNGTAYTSWANNYMAIGNKNANHGLCMFDMHGTTLNAGDVLTIASTSVSGMAVIIGGQ